MQAEAQAAADDDRGIYNDFPVLRPDQKIPPSPPSRKVVPQSSTPLEPDENTGPVREVHV